MINLKKNYCSYYELINLDDVNDDFPENHCLLFLMKNWYTKDDNGTKYLALNSGN